MEQSIKLRLVGSAHPTPIRFGFGMNTKMTDDEKAGCAAILYCCAAILYGRVLMELLSVAFDGRVPKADRLLSAVVFLVLLSPFIYLFIKKMKEQHQLWLEEWLKEQERLKREEQRRRTQWESLLARQNELKPEHTPFIADINEFDFDTFIEREVIQSTEGKQPVLSNSNLYESLLGLNATPDNLTYYQIAGVEEYCDDVSAIKTAILDRYGSLLALQNSPDFDDIQVLMRMLGQAKITLLDPEKKAEYDKQLKSAL